ncbi:hypothetical protein [Gemmobacter nectariphilus]|nr:hypothetical protein [Gemmobacter nectariphilus]
MITLTEVEAAPLDQAEWQADVCLTGVVSGLSDFKPERDVGSEQMAEAVR